MVELSIENHTLLLKDASSKIFDWNHRAFFSISLGFTEESNMYTFSDQNEFPRAIEEILEYLNESSIPYSTDEKVRNIITNIKNYKIEFDSVKKDIGKKIEITDSMPIIRELKPYQIKGYEHFLQIKHGANFSVPGSGKTTMVYAYFNKIKGDGIVDKLFVVGPYSSFSPWEEEGIECFGRKMKVARLVGTKRQAYYLRASKYEMFLCNYQTVANDVSEIINLCQEYRVLMVIDESHYMKKFEGGVWATSLLRIAPYATRRVILSGTPMPNGFKDLWSQMTFLWPGKQLMGDRNSYRNRVEINQHEEIKREIRPFFHRVKKTDLKLPTPQFIRKEYSLKPIQSKIYQALSIKLLSELKLQPEDKNKLKHWRKAKMIRLLQTASNPTLLSKYSAEFEIPPIGSEGSSLIELIDKYSKFETPAKFVTAIKLIRTLLSQGKKVILWTVFVHNIKMLENALNDINYYSIHGSIPKDDKSDLDNRERRIFEFKTTKQPSLLIANPAACAESISLHEACHDAIYLDRSFNCGQYIQSLDRIDRISNKPVRANYYILIARNTIDETIDKRLEDKKKTMNKVLEDDVPIGAFDVEDYEMEQSEDEEKIDFDETVKDARKFLKKR